MTRGSRLGRGAAATPSRHLGSSPTLNIASPTGLGCRLLVFLIFRLVVSYILFRYGHFVHPWSHTVPPPLSAFYSVVDPPSPLPFVFFLSKEPRALVLRWNARAPCLPLAVLLPFLKGRGGRRRPGTSLRTRTLAAGCGHRRKRVENLQIQKEKLFVEHSYLDGSII